MRFARWCLLTCAKRQRSFLLCVICDLLCVICVILACFYGRGPLPPAPPAAGLDPLRGSSPQGEGELVGFLGGGGGVVLLVELPEDGAGAGDDLADQLELGVAVAGGGRDTAIGTDLGGAVWVVDGILLGFAVAGVPFVGGLGTCGGGLGLRDRGRRRLWGGVAFGGGGHEAGGTVLDPGVLVAVGGEGLALVAGGLDAEQQGACGVGGAHVAVGHGRGTSWRVWGR